MVWKLHCKTDKYYYWERTLPDGKIIYQCTKDKIKPSNDAGYYELRSLMLLKNEPWLVIVNTK